jgi:hypothetical protein
MPVLVSSVSRRARRRRFWASLSFPFRGARIVCLLVGFPSTIKRFVFQVGFPSTFKTVVLATGFPSAVRTVSVTCINGNYEPQPSQFFDISSNCCTRAKKWLCSAPEPP